MTRFAWLLLAVTLAACNGSTSTSGGGTPVPATPVVIATPTAVPASAAPSEAPITLRGHGGGQTAPFNLAGGSYAVTLSATKAAGSDFCDTSTGASLKAVGSTDFSDIPVGSGYVNDVAPGRYYVAGFMSGCDWTVTITP